MCCRNAISLGSQLHLEMAVWIEYVVRRLGSSKPLNLQDTIIRLLYSLGSRHEVERYLRIFTQSSKSTSGAVLPEAKFAVLKCVDESNSDDRIR